MLTLHLGHPLILLKRLAIYVNYYYMSWFSLSHNYKFQIHKTLTMQLLIFIWLIDAFSNHIVNTNPNH
jgi:hypothetical protein